jgi:hypothetical protein
VSGVLAPGPPDRRQAADEFRESMRSLGWIEGRTVSIEYRFDDGDPALLSANAAAFVAEKVDVIVSVGSTPMQPAKPCRRSRSSWIQAIQSLWASSPGSRGRAATSPAFSYKTIA